jgi:hypothetical protein
VTTTQGAVVGNSTTGTFGALLGELASGASALVRVTVVPKEAGSVSGQASVTTTQPEINTATNAASLSVTVSAVAPPDPADTPPTVTLLRRFGVHTRPASLQIGFSNAMDPARAANLANYTLIRAGRDNRIGTADDVTVALATATYDATNRQVILTTRNPYPLHQRVQLTINGTNATTGVADLDGVLLDGAYTGEPGSNFVRRFSAYGPGNITGPAALFAAARRR